MPFGIPNAGSASYPPQAEPDSGDFSILAAGPSGTGVRSGCAVSPQGTPDMTVAVASGTIAVDQNAASVTAGNVTITAAHATNPRFDLIVVSSAGVKSVVAGTPAATPVFPAIPASSVVLAAVYVPAAVAAITTAMIIDKRVTVAAAASATVVMEYQPAADIVSGTGGTMADADATNLKIVGTVPASGMCLVTIEAAYYKNGAVSNGYAGVRIGTTNYAKKFVTDALSTAASRVTSRHILTGLPPGSTTFKMAIGADSQTMVLYANGGASCPVVMTFTPL